MERGLKGGWSGSADRDREDLAEKTINYRGVAHDQVMTSSLDDVGGSRKPDRKNFVPGAVDMEKRPRDFVILPIDDGVYGPGDKTVIALRDHLPHKLKIFA